MRRFMCKQRVLLARSTGQDDFAQTPGQIIRFEDEVIRVVTTLNRKAALRMSAVPLGPTHVYLADVVNAPVPFEFERRDLPVAEISTHLDRLVELLD